MNKVVKTIKQELRRDETNEPFLRYVARLEWELAKARRARRDLELRLADIEALDALPRNI